MVYSAVIGIPFSTICQIYYCAHPIYESAWSCLL